MKIGSTILLIIAIFIAFGFAISDDLQVRNDLAKAGQQLSSCQDGMRNSQQIISNLENEKTELIQTLSLKDVEIASLKSEISQQTSKIEKLERAVSASSNHNQPPQKRPFDFPLSENDPILITGMLITQLVITLVQKRWKTMKSTSKDKGDYILLSPEEKEKIIGMRRAK